MSGEAESGPPARTGDGQAPPATSAGRRRKRRGWLWAAGLYAALLLSSHLVAWLSGAKTEPLAPGERAIEVPAIVGDHPVAGSVRLAWGEWGPGGRDASPERGAGERRIPVLLLHGSPGSHADFHGLGPALAADGRHVLAPDLPGFGASTHEVPDHSIRAHAAYTLELLDRLGIERVDVVGYSMGGGVALDLWDLAPGRVASLTLLSGIGVQELELLGDYRLNHLVHGAQLALLWLLDEGFPHFGLLDRFPLNVEYARNFYDSDQRPLRGILSRVTSPALVIHGDHDPLVPLAAAREHARLMPQSELVVLPTDHFYLFVDPRIVEPPLISFFERVDAGEMPTRARADPARVAAAAAPFDRAAVPPATGMAVLVLGLLLAVATLVSEDLTTIGAGLLVATGRLTFVPATLACLAGIFFGDLLLFAAGRLLGRRGLRLPPLSWWIEPRAVNQASAWFRRRGPAVILASRFLPGTRLPTYFAAGVLRTGFWRFCGYFLLAAALWTPALVALSAALGRAAGERLAALEHRAVLFVLLLAVALLLLRKVVLPLFTWRGRRRLLGTWRRWTRWEFWPPWLFYPPIVLYALYLGLRHRGLTLFTAANPGMPAGGVIGESKAEILAHLAGASAWLPRWELLPEDRSPAERAAAVERFRERHGLDFPVVLKPDAGQRGAGVAVARSGEEVSAYFAAPRGPVLVQEHVAGVELGVFYYRLPGEERGHLFSITEKRMPEVVGDGRRSVEELILADPRAVVLADLYLELQGENRGRVPAAGEPVPLSELGTHCRGAIFLDGSRLATPELEAVIDRISRCFEGFSFGRYDVRTGSAEDLARGGPLKVIELNGVTSEATHIYDPRYGLFAAWRILARQWRLAFAIGAAHRAAGVRPVSLGAFLRLLVDYRRSLRLRSSAADPAGPTAEGSAAPASGSRG